MKYYGKIKRWLCILTILAVFLVPVFNSLIPMSRAEESTSEEQIKSNTGKKEKTEDVSEEKNQTKVEPSGDATSDVIGEDKEEAVTKDDTSDESTDDKNNTEYTGGEKKSTNADEEEAFDKHSLGRTPSLPRPRRSITGTWSGNGSETTPYEISTPDDLKALSDDVASGETFAGKYFIVTADLDLSGYTSWVPIGSSRRELIFDHSIDDNDPLVVDNNNTMSDPFEGNFDGNNKTITGLTINKPTTNGAASDYNGLFGFLHNGSISNVIISGANIQGQSGTGVLLGYGRDNVTVSNCHVLNSTVNSTQVNSNYGTAALIGELKYYGNTSGPAVVSVTNSTVENTTVNSKNGAGRNGILIGQMSAYFSNSMTTLPTINSKVTIKDCDVINSSLDSTVYYIGGIVGCMDYRESNSNEVTIDNCDVSGGGTNHIRCGSYYMGGAIGFIWCQGVEGIDQCTNNTFLIQGCDVSGMEISNDNYEVGGLIGFLDIHRNADGNTYTLKNNTVNNCNIFSTGSFNVGGLIGLYYTYFANDNTVNIEQCFVNDCTMYSTANYNVGGFVGHYLIDSSQNNVENIINSGVRRSTISQNTNNRGGFIGRLELINNVNGTVCTIKNTYADAKVNGTVRVGGLIGYLYNPSTSGVVQIINCYTMGSVTATATAGYAGGLIGYCGDNGKSTIKNSYSISSTSASTSGGLIGYNGNASTQISNCYAAGFMSGTSTTRGGFVGGGLKNATTFTNCFYDTTTTGRTASQAFGNAAQAGITGVSTGYELNKAPGMTNIETFSSWNIKSNFGGASKGQGTDDNPWYIDDKITYPYLYYQYDGYSKDDVNYQLSNAKYSFDDGTVTDKAITPRRADYFISNADNNEKISYTVKTAGAAAVFYPYTLESYNFGQNESLRVPSGTGSFTVTSKTTPYSLGGISKTDIVGFDPLPYAEKTSDRAKYVAGTTSTYTKRGDLITYTVSIYNPSTIYKWVDVTLNDPFPEGVTLVDYLYNGTKYNVKVAVGDGTPVIVPKNTAEGNEPYYYTYTKATTSSGVDGPLNVYLGDMPIASENANGELEPYKVTVTFTAIIDRRAVSKFPLDNAQNKIDNGDNIRNIGTVSGTIKENASGEGAFDYSTKYDDNDTDPVYDTYKVSYIGNGGKTAVGDTRYNYYYLYDQSSTVKDNDGNPFLFKRLYYTYLDKWDSRPDFVEGSTKEYQIGDTLALTNNLNPINSANRTDTDNADDINDDYYAATDFKLYAPWKEDKGSIKIIKKSEDGDFLDGAKFLLEKKDGDNWIPIKWDSTSSSWINLPSGETYSGETAGSGGELTFGKEETDNTLKFGVYRITEVGAKEGYQLLKDPLIVTLPYEKASSTDPNDSWNTTYVNDNGETMYSYYNLTYTVTNVGAFELPKAGNKNVFPFLEVGLFIAFLGIAIQARRYRRAKRGRKP
ncbi:MAG: hypothetical protein LBM02_09150 [Lachnospiraceae bacterium]|jgi:hypothetical protein|nr:hypothetical protein [Lachnospiraceae bacterium]